MFKILFIVVALVTSINAHERPEHEWPEQTRIILTLRQYLKQDEHLFTQRLAECWQQKNFIGWLDYKNAQVIRILQQAQEDGHFNVREIERLQEFWHIVDDMGWCFKALERNFFRYNLYNNLRNQRIDYPIPPRVMHPTSLHWMHINRLSHYIRRAARLLDNSRRFELINHSVDLSSAVANDLAKIMHLPLTSKPQ